MPWVGGGANNSESKPGSGGIGEMESSILFIGRLYDAKTGNWKVSSHAVRLIWRRRSKLEGAGAGKIKSDDFFIPERGVYYRQQAGAQGLQIDILRTGVFPGEQIGLA